MAAVQAAAKTEYMRSLRIVLLIVTLAVITFFLVAAVLPSEYHIERRVAIEVSPDTVFRQINTLQNWEHWNPQMPSMEYNDIEAGAGARKEWETPAGGTGFLEINRSIPGELIQAEVRFPGYDTFQTAWMLRPVKDSTYITWGMDFGGLAYPAGRYSGVLTNKRMQANIHMGLQNLKAFLEEDK